MGGQWREGGREEIRWRRLSSDSYSHCGRTSRADAEARGPGGGVGWVGGGGGCRCVGDRCGHRLESRARLHGDGNQGRAGRVGVWGVIKDRGDTGGGVRGLLEMI